jgi:hypothetical protein
MKLKIQSAFILCLLAAAGCEDVKLPRLERYDIDATFHLTPQRVVDPSAELNGSAAQPFPINPNPDGLTLSAYKADDGTYHVKLRGAVRSGIPRDLLLYGHPNALYDPSVGTSGPEPLTYRYGDYKINSYLQFQDMPDTEVSDPNFTPKYLDTSASNTRIAGRGIRYAAVTISGVLEEKDKKGNQRDLSKNVVIIQRNEALNLLANDPSALAGGNDAWSFSVNRAASPPEMRCEYKTMHPEDFPEAEAVSGKRIKRGGIPFLIWEGASEKKVYFTVSYMDGGTSKVEVDYSQVSFYDVRPTVIWFYSDYLGMPAPTPPRARPPHLLPSQLVSPDKDASGAFKDVYGTYVTRAHLEAPEYDPADNTKSGPFPYFIPQDAETLPSAKSGTSEKYKATITDTNQELVLLPVFYPYTAIARIVWDYGEAVTATHTIMENRDGSISIYKVRNSSSGPTTLSVSAAVTTGSGSSQATMVLQADITLQDSVP